MEKTQKNWAKLQDGNCQICLELTKLWKMNCCQLGLLVPVLLQTHWGESKLYIFYVTLMPLLAWAKFYSIYWLRERFPNHCAPENLGVLCYLLIHGNVCQFWGSFKTENSWNAIYFFWTVSGMSVEFRMLNNYDYNVHFSSNKLL